jgi:general secretion pathway protein D
MRRLLYIVLGASLLMVLQPSVVAQQGADADTGVVNFTFDQVDVRTFVKLVGEMTGKRFVVGYGIEGKITVVSPEVRRSQVYPLFLSILESVGCSVMADGEFLRVVALTTRPTPLAPVVGPGDVTPQEGVVTKVLRLEHVSASELRKVLETKVGSGEMGGVGAIEETNHLIVTDTAANVRRIEALVAEIDLPGLARVTEVISLSFASADDMADQLGQALLENATRAQQLRKRLTGGGALTASESRTASVVAAPHSNSLILVGTTSQIQALRDLIAKMDVDVPSGRGRLNAIFLRHLSAEEAAESISALLAKRDGGKDAPPASRRIAIQASLSSNALLVDASPGDFDVVKRLIDQLDEAPDQVHINVLILEVSTSEGLELGVDLAAIDMPAGVGDSVVQGGFSLGDSAGGLLSAIQSGVFPRGLSVGVAHGSSVGSDGTLQVGYPGLFNLDAVKKNGRFKVVSETSLQSLNNKEANVSVVDEIPILKSEISGGSGTSRDIIKNIERMDVGVKLKITPHVIPGGQIRMELNPSIEAVIDSGSEDTQFTPTIARRQVETTVTVEDGKTIVIAGLTRQDELESVKRVPILSSIPLLGWLFRRTETSMERRDVLIFVTPTVVSDMASADAVRQHWEEKTGLEQDGN